MNTPAPNDVTGLHEKPLDWQDLQRARSWSLQASYLEEQTGVSALSAICHKFVEDKEISELTWSLFEWCLKTGASVRKLEQDHSSLFFNVARVRGGLKLWTHLIEAGYSLDKVTARFKESGVLTTTKLGLLTSAPYCYSPDLMGLIRLLVDKGVNPNERDSEGVAPLGRLNEQLRGQESRSASPLSESIVEDLIRGVETLLSLGATPDGILPLPEKYAAKCLQDRIKAAMEKITLSAEIKIIEVDHSLDSHEDMAIVSPVSSGRKVL